jgi:ATP/maltotriose-dependent transcriptional regulator MalT
MPLFLHPDVINALLLLYVGRHAEARDGLAGVWSAALDRGDESHLAFIGLWRSWLESRSGDFTAALALAEEAMALASLTGSESTQWHLVAQRALTHACRGDMAAALRDCAEAATRLDVPWVAVWVAAARGTLELARGDPRGLGGLRGRHRGHRAGRPGRAGHGDFPARRDRGAGGDGSAGPG